MGPIWPFLSHDGCKLRSDFPQFVAFGRRLFCSRSLAELRRILNRLLCRCGSFSQIPTSCKFVLRLRYNGTAPIRVLPRKKAVFCVIEYGCEFPTVVFYLTVLPSMLLSFVRLPGGSRSRCGVGGYLWGFASGAALWRPHAKGMGSCAGFCQSRASPWRNVFCGIYARGRWREK